jgi:hypothetical protein
MTVFVSLGIINFIVSAVSLSYKVEHQESIGSIATLQETLHKKVSAGYRQYR